MLSIGAVLMGPTDGGRCENAVRALGLRVRDERDGLDSPVYLNLVFHVGGRFGSPEFSGVRTGRFRKADGLLMIQAALIPDQVADADAEVRRLLLAAVEEAEHWAQSKKLADALPAVRDVADRASRADR